MNDSVYIKTASYLGFSIFLSLGHTAKENIEKQKKNNSNSNYEAAIVVCKTLNVLCT